MYFKKNVCPNCQYEYDELADYCPFCYQRNDVHQEFRNKYPMLYLPPAREIFLMILGLGGMALFSLTLSLIFRNVYQDNPILGLTLINTCSYVIFIAFIIALIYPYWKMLLDKLKKYDAYLYGAIGSVVLIGGSIGINMLMRLIYPGAGEGGNQSTAIVIAKTYPAIAILILGIIGPICEEFSYRVGLFTLLRRIHPLAAYLGTCLIFGLIHFDFTSTDLLTELIMLPGYMWGGLVFSFLYERKGIGASTTAHIINNLYSIIVILLL